MRAAERIQHVLSHRLAPAVIIAVGTLAVCASLNTGLAADDRLHQLILDHSQAFRGFQREPWDLFRFAAPASNRDNLNDGVFPWWADPDVRFAFFRPLAALSHMVDHAVFPKNAFLAHLHSIFWWALSAVGVAAVYRRMLSPAWVSALALLFYTLDDARGAPVAWVANRNALIGCAVSMWALYAFVRHRGEGWKPGRWMGPLALLVGLTASEGAISVFAYLLAYSVFVDERPPAARAAALAPYAVVIAVWFGLARALDYGVSGSSIYLDPIGDAGLFLRLLPERFTVLLYAVLGGPWSELWNGYSFLLPGAQYAVLAAAVLTIGFVAWLLLPLWRHAPTVRFWIVGSLLSIVPACAAFPADRLLLWVSVGSMAAIAELCAAFVRKELPSRGARGALVTVGVLGLAVIHGLIGPALLPMRSRGIAQVRESIERVDQSIPKTADVASKTLVYVNPPADPFASFIPIRREALGIPRPKRQRWLATGESAVRIERIDEQTLLVRPQGGFIRTASEGLLRGPEYLSHVGDRATLSGMEVTITAVEPDGRPGEAQVHFDEPLDSPNIEFLVWLDGRYEPFELPAVGQSVVVPAADLLRLAFGDESPVTRTLGTIRTPTRGKPLEHGVTVP